MKFLFFPVFARLALVVVLILAVVSPCVGAGPKVLEKGVLPNDHRLEPLKDLNGYFPFEAPKTKAEWEARAEDVRMQMRVALGLWPEPERTPLNAVIHGKVQRHDYTVEKVFFESLPGFYVTGNLYRPVGYRGKRPVVLCPHGHWKDSRFYDKGIDAVRREIVIGSERFEEGGRNHIQARCVHLARMGCVVFHYDMIGYSDSQQITYQVAHRFAKQRPEMNTVKNWGLFSPQAESHLQNVMGLQTWNSIRSVDFVLSLPEVDASRIAVTGASGGGTQTMILAALDPRIAVSVPAVMVSTAMQGGCTCENASLLRIGTGNVEFAALFAPKPQGLTAADDWTAEMETKGFPDLQTLYKLLGAPKDVTLWANTHFKHNYNYVNRASMYAWLNRHFKLGFKEPIVEDDYRRLTFAETTVWNEEHPQPEGGPEFERKLAAWLHRDSRKQLAEARKDAKSYRALVLPALRAVYGRALENAGTVEWDMADKLDRGAHLEMYGLLRNVTHGEEIPAVFLYPKEWNGRTVIWITDEGKSGLFQAADSGYAPIAEVRKLLDAGVTVAGIDLLFQGEFLADGKAPSEARKVENPREFAGYTHGYNHSLFARRVHDILSVVNFTRNDERQSRRIDLVGADGSGHWVAAARALAGEAVDGAAIHTGGFRFHKIMDIRDPDFQPGGAKYDDLPGLLAMGAPGPLWVAGEDPQARKMVAAGYGGTADQVEFAGQDAGADDAVEWLLTP